MNSNRPRQGNTGKNARAAARMPVPLVWAAGEGRESDGHVLPLNPEFFLLILAKIHREDHTRAAGPAPRNPEIRSVVPAAVGTPVFHEFLGPVIPARFGVGATEQCIRRLVVVRGQVVEELLNLMLLAVIMKNKEERPTGRHQGQKRDRQGLDDLFAPGVAGAVLIQITGHLLFNAISSF